jgi:hypothetical protein
MPAPTTTEPAASAAPVVVAQAAGPDHAAKAPDAEVAAAPAESAGPQASGPEGAPAPATGPGSAPRPAAKVTADGKALAPVDVAPRLGKLKLPLISDEDKAEARRVRRAREEALAAGLPASNAMTAAVDGKVAPRPAGTEAAPAFALSTRVLRTRAEAEQVRVAMDALLRAVKASEIHTDILPQGDDWRVVGWPFARRDLAEQARTLLVARGMRVEIVAF